MLGTAPNGPAGPNPRDTGAIGGARRNGRSAWAAGLCVLFAAIAIGHGLWSMYGSGDAIASFDIIRTPIVPAHPGTPLEATPPCATFGPCRLTPEMSPLRVVLYTGYTPMGATRQRFEIAMVDDAGHTLWDRRGTIGNPEEDATFVASRMPLADFHLEHASTCSFEVSFPEGSMDDLREARLEVREGIPTTDPRITWGFGLAALACLLIQLLSPKSESYPPASIEREEYREAA